MSLFHFTFIYVQKNVHFLSIPPLSLPKRGWRIRKKKY